MKADGKTLVIKCNNTAVHNGKEKDPGEGNILIFLRKNSIFIQCSNHRCKRWNRIDIDTPGVNIDFANMSYIQSKMPKDYHFDAVKASVIIKE
jgi:hypothetical protein